MASGSVKKRRRKRHPGAKDGKPTVDERLRWGSMAKEDFEALPRGKDRKRGAYVRHVLAAEKTNKKALPRTPRVRPEPPPVDPALIEQQANAFAGLGVEDPAGILEVGFMAAGGMEAFKTMAANDPQMYFQKYLGPALQRKAEQVKTVECPVCKREEEGVETALEDLRQWMQGPG